MEGNRQDKPVEAKTQEQLEQERSERFTKDPHSFVELSELICASIHSSKSDMGIGVLVNINCKRSDLNNSQAELNNKIDVVRRSMDVEAEMRRQKLIVPGNGKPHNIISGARHLFGRK